MNKDKTELKIEYIQLRDLTPYENNARKHEKADLQTIENSIDEFGMCDPIGIWGKQNIIVEGHGRLLALQELGYEEAPCIRLDHLTDEQRRAYALAHNKTSEMSQWDFDKLEAELAKLDELGVAMDGFGFEGLDGDIPEITEDDVPEIDEENEPITKRGQIWKMGNHYLMCGDATNAKDVEKLMSAGECPTSGADLLFTDPPYGYEYQSNQRTKSAKFDVIKNDDKILDFMPAIKKCIDGFVFICTSWKVIDRWTELFKRYYELTNIVIWNKGGGGMGDLEKTFSTDYEMILVANNGYDLKGRRFGSVWNFSKTEIEKMKKQELIKILLDQQEFYSVWNIQKDNSNDYIHPTQKPVALAARAIRSTTEKGDTVLDVFGGSGTTLIACEQMQRKCRMMELDPKYCDVIIKRWEALTGQKSELIERN